MENILRPLWQNIIEYIDKIPSKHIRKVIAWNYVIYILHTPLTEEILFKIKEEGL